MLSHLYGHILLKLIRVIYLPWSARAWLHLCIEDCKISVRPVTNVWIELCRRSGQTTRRGIDGIGMPSYTSARTLRLELHPLSWYGSRFTLSAIRWRREPSVPAAGRCPLAEQRWIVPRVDGRSRPLGRVEDATKCRDEIIHRASVHRVHCPSDVLCQLAETPIERAGYSG